MQDTYSYACQLCFAQVGAAASHLDAAALAVLLKRRMQF